MRDQWEGMMGKWWGMRDEGWGEEGGTTKCDA